jgi:hypothetical protein
MAKIVDEVAARTGLDGPAAMEAIAIVNDAVASRVGRIRAGELLFRLARRLGIPPGRAVEVAQIACHAIGERLDPDARRQLLRCLPGDMRELFGPPPSQEAPAAGKEILPGTGHTLADGRPGSAHSLTRSRPGSEHPLSESRPPARRTR